MKGQSFASLFLVLFLAATAACLSKPAGGPNVSPTVQAPTNTAIPRTQSTVAAAAPTATATTAAPTATATAAAPSIPFPDPAGLDRLDSYNLTLRITFKGTWNGQAVETSDLYTRAFWRQPPAQFTTIETTDEDGTPIKWLFGSVGETQYLRTGPDEPCTVQRGKSSGESKPFNPAIMLRPVWYGKEMGQETVNGVAARHYAIDASSLGQGPSKSAATCGLPTRALLS